jgi:hypothetical protein
MVPQIRQLINDPHFIASTNEIKSCAWSSSVLVVKNVLGNKKADNYTPLVEDMLLISTGLVVHVYTHVCIIYICIYVMPKYC